MSDLNRYRSDDRFDKHLIKARIRSLARPHSYSFYKTVIRDAVKDGADKDILIESIKRMAKNRLLVVLTKNERPFIIFWDVPEYLENLNDWYKGAGKDLHDAIKVVCLDYPEHRYSLAARATKRKDIDFGSHVYLTPGRIQWAVRKLYASQQEEIVVLTLREHLYWLAPEFHWANLYEIVISMLAVESQGLDRMGINRKGLLNGLVAYLNSGRFGKKHAKEFDELMGHTFQVLEYYRSENVGLRAPEKAVRTQVMPKTPKGISEPVHENLWRAVEAISAKGKKWQFGDLVRLCTDRKLEYSDSTVKAWIRHAVASGCLARGGNYPRYHYFLAIV